MNYTTVVGVDEKHLRQLALVWPTWRKHKPSLLDHPMVVFYDRYQVTVDQVMGVCDHSKLKIVPWPPDGVSYSGGTDRWHDPDPQRKKMLAGFVHVPTTTSPLGHCSVETDYWLKLDTDTIATGCDDWIDPAWFEGNPAIVAQKWGFTKPGDQMVMLDKWADEFCYAKINRYRPLNLIPKPGASRISHKRIISWCGFFQTDFTLLCSVLAERSCGRGQLPVPSQDGYMWYCAKRMEEGIERINVKSRGWLHRSSMRNVEQESAKALE